MNFKATLDSTHLNEVAFDSRASVLVIEFQDGSRYAYAPVSVAEAVGLLGAESAGVYFNLKIKGKPYIKVGV